MPRETLNLALASHGVAALDHKADRVSRALNWAGLSRVSDAERTLDLLRKPDGLGVIITGDRGVGKSALGRQVISMLGEEVHTLQLRGAASGVMTPYGCLSFMLARLPQASLGSPTAILHGLSSLIRNDAEGRESFILLDNAGALDELSTGVLVNVVKTAGARIVAIAQRASDLPADFYSLISSGHLEEVHLSALSEAETAQALREVLGNRIAGDLAHQLHQFVGGRPTLLQAVITEQIDKGNLVLTGSEWSLRNELILDGRSALEEIVRARYSRSTPAARQVIDMLSCARRLPLAKLAAVVGPNVLADMEDTGQILVDRTGRHLVSLGDQYVGDAVRNWLTPERRLALRDMVPGHSPEELSQLTVEDLLAYAAWTYDCQAELDPAHALASAQAAVQLFDPKFALECLKSVDSGQPEWALGQRQKALAYLQLGLPRQAMFELEDIPEPMVEQLPLLAFAEMLATKVECMARLNRPREQVVLEIKQGKLRLEAMPSASEDRHLVDALQCLELAESSYFCFVGDYQAALERLRAAARKGDDDDNPGFRLNSAILLMEALTMTGQEMEARKLMRELGGQIGDFSHIPGIRENFASRSYYVSLLSGQWHHCIDMLKDNAGRKNRGTGSHESQTDLGIGLAYVFAGRGHLALDSLLSAISQLEHRPGSGSLQQAHAAAAYAYAQMGNTLQAKAQLDKAASLSQASSFPIEVTTNYCLNMAMRWLGDSGAKDSLIQSAKDHIHNGRWTVAEIYLLGATIHGTSNDFELLEQVALRCQSPLAELSGKIAVGGQKQDPGLMLAAGVLAGSMELDTVQACCAVLAMEYSRSAGLFGLTGTAHEMLDRLVTTLPTLPIASRASSPLLTERERQIASLAANGASNRDIAHQIGISVRTVEGHLYQVFTKLDVTSRGDLLGIVR